MVTKNSDVISTARVDAKIAAARSLDAEIQKIRSKILHGGHTDDPLKDWALVNFGAEYKEPFSRARKLEKYLAQSDGWILISENWVHGAHHTSSIVPGVEHNPHTYNRTWVFKSSQPGLVVRGNPDHGLLRRIEELESIDPENTHSQMEIRDMNLLANADAYRERVDKQPFVVYPKWSLSDKIYFEGIGPYSSGGYGPLVKIMAEAVPFFDYRIFTTLNCIEGVFGSERLNIKGMRTLLSKSQPDQLLYVMVVAGKKLVLDRLFNLTENPAGYRNPAAKDIRDLHRLRT